MIKWLTEQILHIVRQLDHSLFLSQKQRASLKKELSKLLKMRNTYHEHQRQEKTEIDKLEQWEKD